MKHCLQLMTLFHSWYGLVQFGLLRFSLHGTTQHGTARFTLVRFAFTPQSVGLPLQSGWDSYGGRDYWLRL